MAQRANPDLLSDRAKRDKTLRSEIDRVWEQNYKVYGVRKVWHQMRREGFDVAR
jgi:transposase InsO family protein